MIKTKKNIETAPQPANSDKKKDKLKIGLLKEIDKEEKRVALTPDDIKIIVSYGTEVLVEQGAGEGAGLTNSQYIEAGAKLTADRKDILQNSEIICKISPLNSNELNLLGTHKILFSAINLSTQKKEFITILQQKKTTAIAYEFYEDITGFNPFTHAIGEITGTSAVMIASELLSTTSGGKGILLGSVSGFPPAEMIVLGTDISAEYAVRLALELGVSVKVFDNNLPSLIKFHKTFGQHLYTSTINYSNIQKEIRRADVLINTLTKESGIKIFTPELISTMKKGSVIIDLKVDQGSIIETSKITSFNHPTYSEKGIIHYCVPNLASRVSYTSSMAISNLLTPTLIKIIQQKSIIPYLQYDSNIRRGTYLFKGVLTNKIIAERFNLDFTDINFIVHVF